MQRMVQRGVGQARMDGGRNLFEKSHHPSYTEHGADRLGGEQWAAGIGMQKYAALTK